MTTDNQDKQAGMPHVPERENFSFDGLTQKEAEEIAWAWRSRFKRLEKRSIRMSNRLVSAWANMLEELAKEVEGPVVAKVGKLAAAMSRGDKSAEIPGLAMAVLADVALGEWGPAREDVPYAGEHLAGAVEIVLVTSLLLEQGGDELTMVCSECNYSRAVVDGARPGKCPSCGHENAWKMEEA